MYGSQVTSQQDPQGTCGDRVTLAYLGEHLEVVCAKPAGHKGVHGNESMSWTRFAGCLVTPSQQRQDGTGGRG